MAKKFTYPKELINKNNTGLTLIEVLIALVITTIVIAALFTTYNLVNKQFLQQSERGNKYNSARNLITIISRDLRMAGFQHYTNNTPINDPIFMNKNSCNQICIEYDIDDKNSYQRRRIIYYVKDDKDGNKSVYKNVEKKTGDNYTILDEYENEEDRILAKNIEKLEFTFFDKDGTASKDFSKNNHATVEIEITMKINDNIDDILSTEVFLRNIYYYWHQE